MHHPVLKPAMTIGLIAVAGTLFWLFWFGDPCLGTEIANQWVLKNPPDVAPPASPGDLVDVENPYGVMTCHYRPSAADDFLTPAVLAIVCFAIGWLAARRISHRPRLAAAAITTVAMLIALSLQFWARWEDVSSFHAAEGRLLQLDLLALLAFFLVAAGIASLGAWVALRFTRRA